MKHIRAALPSGNEPISAQLRGRLSDPVLLTAIRVRVMVVTGIVFLMTAKIPFVSSLVALSIAIVLGLIFSVSAWSRTT
jgi:hydrogenase/urease accessory protein HupE